MPRRARVSARAPLAFQLEEVREHALARHRYQRLLQAAIEPRHDRIRTGDTFAQQPENLPLALLAMLDVAAQDSLRILNDRTVRRQELSRPEREHALE